MTVNKSSTDSQAIRQLRFVANITGTVDVSDGEEGSQVLTAEDLVKQIESSIEIMISSGGLTGDTPGVVETNDYEVRAGETISAQHQTIFSLREQGYAIVVFSPDELGSATSSSLENRLVELGNEAISDLQD